MKALQDWWRTLLCVRHDYQPKSEYIPTHEAGAGYGGHWAWKECSKCNKISDLTHIHE